MSRVWLGTFCATAIWGGMCCDSSVAQQPGFSQIDVHNPYSSHYVPLTPMAPRQGTFGGLLPGGWSGGSWVFGPGGFYSYYPAYVGPFVSGGMLSPFVMPPGVMPGVPAPNGWAGAGNPMPLQGKPAQPVAAKRDAGGFGLLAPNAAVGKAPQKPRVSNAEARARSQRFIVLGDGYFSKQQYSDAYQRYKLAAQSAPDMSDGFLREGFVLVALGRYDSAARSFKRGIMLEPNWAESAFRLDLLYAENGLAKAAHLEALAQEAVRAPSSDIMFLFGVMLYFDGRPDRAAPFFHRSRELAGGDDAHLDGFLRKLAPQAPADEAPAPAKPAVVPVAKRDVMPASRATAVPPFSAQPKAPIDLDRAKKAAPKATEKPARDL